MSEDQLTLDLVEEFIVTEFGLKLPNGEVAWGQYLGRLLVTGQDRATMVAVLKQTASEVGFAEDDFLARYSWVTRKVLVRRTFPEGDHVTHLIDDPEALVDVAPELVTEDATV